MSPRFSLRTLLVIVTAVALIIGGKTWLFGLSRYSDPTDPNDLYGWITYQLQIWRDFPALVVWAAGVEWILRRTSAGERSRRLILAALATNVLWSLFGQNLLYQVLRYLIPTNSYFNYAVVIVIDTVLQVTVWVLVIIAYASLYESQHRSITLQSNPLDE